MSKEWENGEHIESKEVASTAQASKSKITKRTRQQGDNGHRETNSKLLDYDDDDDERIVKKKRIVVDDDDDDDDDDEYGSSKGKTSKTLKKKKPVIDEKLMGANGGYAWEDEIKRSWDIVKEDNNNQLSSIVSGLVEANKLKKIYKDVTPFQRGIIRSLILVVDCSQAMAVKDLRPNRYSLTFQYVAEFVSEFFDQNPISQLGIVAMRNGIATVISDLSGNPIDHINNLKSYKINNNEAKGDPSLQNALEMSRGLLLHTSQHSTKEILIIFGTLFTSDPGDIFKTINHLVAEKIRVRIVGLNAEVSICSKIVEKTNFGQIKQNYGIVLNEHHFKDLMNDCVTPLPAIKKVTKTIKDSSALSNDSVKEDSSISTKKTFNLIKMGFPKRISEDTPTFCSCHSNLNYGGYICPFCKAKICSLPTICPTCNLMLISSTHLARSYHHLFPLKIYEEVPLNVDEKNIVHFTEDYCYSCHSEFPVVDGNKIDSTIVKGSSRYRCKDCEKIYCIDCNVFIHETLHNCPGCESIVK